MIEDNKQDGTTDEDAVTASDTSAATIAINVFTSPGEAFTALRARPRFLLPMLLLLIGAAVVTFLYMSSVDIQFFFEQQASADADLTEEQQAQAAQFGEMIAGIPQGGLAALFAVFSVIGAAVMLLLQALYLKIVSAITKDGVTYKSWLSVVSFCALPTLLASLATVVNLLTSDVSLMRQTAVSPLSFANLLGLDPGSGALAQIAASLDPTTVWALVLTILGYKAFTARSLGTAAAIVLAPALVLIGLSLAF